MATSSSSSDWIKWIYAVCNSTKSVRLESLTDLPTQTGVSCFSRPDLVLILVRLHELPATNKFSGDFRKSGNKIDICKRIFTYCKDNVAPSLQVQNNQQQQQQQQQFQQQQQRQQLQQQFQQHQHQFLQQQQQFQQQQFQQVTVVGQATAVQVLPVNTDVKLFQ